MQYGLVHVAAGDLLRAEIATGSDNGKRAKQYMEKGQLVPDEIVVLVPFGSDTTLSFQIVKLLLLLLMSLFMLGRW